MINKKIIQELKERGIIYQITKQEELIKNLSTSISFYCGFDPTSDSLHVGHLVLLLCIKRLQQAGHKPIILIGNATGFIGDPSFKKTVRSSYSDNTIKLFSEKIKKQILSILNIDNNIAVLNNYDWFKKINILSFLCKIGKYISVNKMIKKESIKQRFFNKNNGISFSEFSYILLQSYDFAFLNKNYGVILQIGGSDQWGNIISGIDLTRHLNNKNVYGFTVPLITKSDGTKFGKTESNTIWLDPKKTSPYSFYQFWINTEDKNVYNFLNLFTFIDKKFLFEIKKIDLRRKKPPIAQNILAENVTLLVHGKEGLNSAKRITDSLFSNSPFSLTKSDFNQLLQDGIPKICIYNKINLRQALIESKLASSGKQAKNLINKNAIKVNGINITDINYIFNQSDKLYGKFTLLKKGKKNHCLIYWK